MRRFRFRRRRRLCRLRARRASHRPRQSPRQRRRQLRLRVVPQRRGRPTRCVVFVFVASCDSREETGPARLRAAPGFEGHVHEHERRFEPFAKRGVSRLPPPSRRFVGCLFKNALIRRRPEEERNRLRRPGVAHAGGVEPTRREARDGGVHAVLRVQERVPRIQGRDVRVSRVSAGAAARVEIFFILGGDVEHATHARPVVSLSARGLRRHRRG